MDAAPFSTPDPATGDAQAELTRLLNAAAEDPARASRLLSRVLDELKVIARRKMRGERVDHTLQPTALVHEAWLRLAEAPGPWRNRAHFYFAAADSMRRILVDHARTRGRLKRGGGQQRVGLDTLSVADLASRDDPDLILTLDDAFVQLAGVNEDAANVVRLRFFTGRSVDEVAEIMEVSEKTVDRLWQFARAYLARMLAQAM